jgi:RNA polymerase sigma-70 factor, ECF subfamily
MLRDGDPAGAEELYARYARRMRALVASRLRGPVASRLSPDDIVQSVFRTLFEGVAERAYAAPEGRELWGLLCVLALNKVRERIAYHQAARRDVRRTGGSVDTVADDDAEAQWLGVEVDDLLGRFRPSDREVIYLRMTGYEVTEIADRTGRSLRTVERVLQKARTRLAEELA